MSKRNLKRISAEVKEMNRRIIKKKFSNPLYIVNDFELMLLNEGEYKANIKKNNKKYKKKKK